MILVVASRVDEVAEKLVSVLPGDAAMLTSVELSQSGWAVRRGDVLASSFVARGQTFESARVSGVVGLLPCIFEQELVDIVPEDRAYVAQEMTAFLIYWLSSLDCPRLNPPTAGCLSGPLWGPERWVVEAARAGLDVQPVHRCTRGAGRARPPRRQSEVASAGPAASGTTDSPNEFVTVTVVGDACLGHDDAALRRQSRALASATRIPLLDVRWVESDTGFMFCGAEPFPDLSQPGMAAAVRDFFERADRR